MNEPNVELDEFSPLKNALQWQQRKMTKFCAIFVDAKYANEDTRSAKRIMIWAICDDCVDTHTHSYTAILIYTQNPLYHRRQTSTTNNFIQRQKVHEFDIWPESPETTAINSIYLFS